MAEIDAGKRAGIDAACKFINHKIGELRRRVVTSAVIAFIGAFIVWGFIKGDPRFPFGVALVVPILVAAHARTELTRWYKNMVVRRVVEAIGDGLTYSRESDLSKEVFQALDLFGSRIDVWKSEDQVCGTRKNISFTMHEAKAARREKRGKNTREILVFQGLIVRLDFNKHFHGHTVVIDDRESKVLGGLLGHADTRNGKNIVHLADADFERVYSAYSTDDQEAHYLLTPKLLQLIMRTRDVLGTVRLAFYKDSVFVTVPSTANRFEVSLFGHVTPDTVAADLVSVVSLTEQLIDSLDLETRIWSRV